MKKITFWLLALALCVMTACEGYTEEELGGGPVVPQPENPENPDKPGKPSEPTVTTSQFVRQICVMDLTGTWCAMCPDGIVFLNSVTGMSSYKDKVHVLGMHSGDSDPFHLDVTDEINNDMGPLGFPAFVTDLRVIGSLNAERAKLKQSFDQSFKEHPAHCGVALRSQLQGGQATVTVRLHAEKTANYRLALYVVEDKIRDKQNKGGTYVNDYLHRHVARQLVSSSYKGDRLGTVEAGKETSKEYVIAVQDAWKLENTSVYALAIDEQGFVNNMAVCQLNNGETDYWRVTE